MSVQEMLDICENNENILKNSSSLNSPIGWVGGKRLLRDEIIKRFPEHKIYVEPFCGAAWVFFCKDPAISEVEIINDIYDEIGNFFRCVRDKHLELIEKLRFRLLCKQDFLIEKEKMGAGSEIDRAARFFYIIKNSFKTEIRSPTFHYSPKKGKKKWNYDTYVSLIEKAHYRLRHVYILSEDYEKIIKNIDGVNTFFYCDPPYFNHYTCYKNEFRESDHKKLSEVLKKIQGKFLLSYDDHEHIRELYSWAKIEEVKTLYSARNSIIGSIQKTELLIRNY